MNNSISVNKLLALGALLCSGMSALMAMRELNHLYIVLFLIIATVGFVIEFKKLPAPPRTVINVFSATLLVVILSQLSYNYIIEPFMKIILTMTAVKMLEKKFARDYMQLLLLSLLMLICHAMVSIDKEFALYCFGGGMLWAFIMMLCSWQAKDYHAVIPLKNLLQLFSRLSVIFLLMLPLCLLMFVIAPRIRSPFLAVHGSQRIAHIGFSDQVSLGDVSEIQRNNRLAFRAEVEKQPSVPYWRGVVLDLFDGRMWISSQSPRYSGYIITTDENIVKQEIFLEPGRRRHLFALDTPVSVSNIQAHVTGDGIIIYRGRNDGRRLQYTAISAVSDVMRMEGANFRRRRYLNLPNNFIPELRNEVERITRGLNQSQKISAILDYLSPPNFEYSLADLPTVPNALEHFIFVSRRGNCEFFASAMGVMLRMGGIPSRLVGGYRGGIYNEAGGHYSVFEESAHVWVELWDEENTSWVRYDPTPHSSLYGAISGNFGFWAAYLDLLDSHWTKFVLNYNLEIQGEMISSMMNIISNPEAFDFTGFFERLPLIFGVTGLIIIVIYFLRKMQNRNEAEVLLRRFILAMKRKGFDKHKSEGLREFSNQLPEHEKTKAMPFVECFEEHYYKEKNFDKAVVKILKENLTKL